MKNDHKRVEALLNQALEFKPDERAAFLIGACGGDQELRRQVETLLSVADETEGFLPDAPTLATAPVSEGPGTKIGRYKLLQKIGEGGMGVVYMAEQTEPVTRKVALKIIKLGMDTKQVVARFEAERQALAMMDHPNIARVLDGGATETGRPYFVMELVQGIPITDFCDKNKLTAKERIELFIPVCQAIQSAHQKGIIHRDIKPSNVMVSLHHGEPMPKVIDFGIAKATNQKLTEKTLFTNYATMIGTPAYMSPEQAEISTLDVDTRTDVYSLGVLLYELLTGTTPFPDKLLRSVGYGELQRIIAEEEPEKPSTRMSTMEVEQKTAVAKSHGLDVSALGCLFKGDLDWIAMKCLEKDRRRRYDTPTELVADLKRHLNNEPVSAAAPSFSYQIQKFYRKNRPALRAAAVVALLLVAATIFSTYQAVRASRSEQRVMDESAIAKAVNEFWNKDILGQANPEVQPDRDIKLRDVLDQAAKSIEGKFKDQPLVEAAVRLSLGRALLQLNDYEAAEPHLRRALEIRRSELGHAAMDTLEAAYSLTRLLWKQSLLLGNQENQKLLDERDSLGEESLAFARTKYGEDTEIALRLRTPWVDILRAHFDSAADALRYRKVDLVAAERSCLDVLDRRRRTLGEDHEQTLWAYSDLGTLLLNGPKRRERAKPILEKGLELAEKKYGRESDKYVLIALKTRLAYLYLKDSPKKGGLIPMWQDIVEHQIRRYGVLDTETLSPMYFLESAYRSAGDIEGAIAYFENLLDRCRTNRGEDSEDTFWATRFLVKEFYIEFRDSAKTAPLIQKVIKDSSRFAPMEMRQGLKYSRPQILWELWTKCQQYEKWELAIQCEAALVGVDGDGLAREATTLKLDAVVDVLNHYLNAGALDKYDATLPAAQEFARAFIRENPPDETWFHGYFAKWSRLLILTEGFEKSYTRLREILPQIREDRWNWYWQATIEAMVKDTEGYLECCRQLLSLAREVQDRKEWGEKDVQALEITLKTCVLMPLSDPAMQAQKNAVYGILEDIVFGPNANREVSSGKELPPLRPFVRVALALKDYRDGNFEKAIKILKPAESTKVESFKEYGVYGIGLLVRAMSEYRLGHPAAARLTLDQAAQSVLQYLPEGLKSDPRLLLDDPDDLVRYYVVRKEAEALILGERSQIEDRQSDRATSATTPTNAVATEAREQ